MTHRDISDPALRKLFAAELLILRRAMKQANEPMTSNWVMGIRLGMETILRRQCNKEYMDLQKGQHA